MFNILIVRIDLYLFAFNDIYICITYSANILIPDDVNSNLEQGEVYNIMW